MRGGRKAVSVYMSATSATTLPSALVALLAFGCNVEPAVPPSTTSAGNSSTEAQEGTSNTDSQTDSDATTGAYSTTGTTAAPPAVCATTAQSECTSPIPCLAMAPDPSSCGENSLFDYDGCPRAKCESQEDCLANEECIDLVPCVPNECVLDFELCEETFGECGCFGSPTCALEMKLCFRFDEHSC